jgi:ABC-type Fe3+ transport system substrate-binding protein
MSFITRCAAATLILLVSSQTGFSRSEQQTLVIVSAHPAPVREEFEQAFMKAMQAKAKDVRIQWIDQGGSVRNLRYVRQKAADARRTAAADVGIDIMWGGGSETFVNLKRDNLLEKIVKPKGIFTAEAMVKGPQALLPGAYDADGYWIGTAMATFGMLVDRQALAKASGTSADQPLTWAMLASPALSGRIAVGDPRASSVSGTTMPGMLRKLGWDESWKVWTGLFGNSAIVGRRTSEVIDSVKKKTAAAGVAIDFLALAAAAKVSDATLTFAVPTPAVDADFDPIAKLAGAPDGELADEFIRFVMSEPAQRIVSQAAQTVGGPSKASIGRLPVLLSLATPEAAKLRVNQADIVGLTAARGPVTDSLVLSDRFVNEVIGASFVDQIDIVRKSWSSCAVAVAGGDVKATPLLKPPFTQLEMAALERRAQVAQARGRVMDEIKSKYKLALLKAADACKK